MPSFSVFFPAYNDAPSIVPLVEKTFQILHQHVEDFEVIVVNDGSRDNTADLLLGLKQQYGDLFRVVTHEKNRGYGVALRSGFASARKEFVFYTDGDGQYDTAELPKLLAEVAPEVGLINGYKLERRDPWHRVAIGPAIYNRFARITLSDLFARYRLRLPPDPPEAAGRDAALIDEGKICVELVRKLELSPYRIVEVGVHHYPRLHGRSQFFRFRSLLTTLYQLVRLYLRLVIRSRGYRQGPETGVIPLGSESPAESRCYRARLETAPRPHAQAIPIHSG